MDRNTALRLLDSEVLSERLRAARVLSNLAEPEDRSALERARTAERTPWVRTAIDRAISRAVSASDPRSVGVGQEAEPFDEADVGDEAYAAAVQDVSDRLVHELRKIVGRARLYARREIEPQNTSRTIRELDRLQDFLKGVETLGHAAAVPRMEEFDLSQVVADEVHGMEVEKEADAPTTRVQIESYGPAPFLVVADISLVRLALANALTNAIEAVRDLAHSDPVVVTWGLTDRDLWLAVLDRGVGLPPNRHQIVEFGSSTKQGHLGLGLALALRGMLSLGGDIDLSRSDDGVTRFEARWPLYGAG